MTSRETGRITIFMKGVRIEGVVFTHGEYRRGRLSDALNRDKEIFISVTDAEIYEHKNEKPIAKEKLLFINKDHILYVKPTPPKKKT